MKEQLINFGRTGNNLLARIGFQIVRYVPVSSGYISAKETIEAAAKNNQTVTDYVETMWQERGIAQQVIDSFKEFGALSPSTKRICEIGTGTGMFADTILKSCDISQYESYEIAKDWAEWLSSTYKIVSHPANGESLDCTDSNSIDLVHANGVFVYTPFLLTIKYFLEISRVTKPQGFAVFDILGEECFDEDSLNSWLESQHLYPCIIPKEYVKEFFTKNGFCYVGEFLRKFGIGKSLYLVFQKQ
jgi:SAM-dependent methyltransferase